MGAWNEGQLPRGGVVVKRLRTTELEFSFFNMCPVRDFCFRAEYNDIFMKQLEDLLNQYKGHRTENMTINCSLHTRSWMDWIYHETRTLNSGQQDC